MEITNGVALHVIHSEKFKDIGISVRFLAPLEATSATARSLLAVMMCDRCVLYPTKKEMSNRQDQLYGTSLHAQTVGYGKAHVLEVRSKVIDPIFVQEKSLLKDACTFLKDIIFQPLLNEETLLEAKHVLVSKLMRMRDNPSNYASSQGLKIGGEGTPLAISSLGELDVLERLTLEEVKQQWETMLQEDRIDLLLCGRIEESDASFLQEVFPFQARNAQFETHYVMEKTACEAPVYEYRDITQSSVFMLWSTHQDALDENYYGLRLGNAMFGQYPSSLLFQEVREKHSLCYSIYANLISFDGALGVSTGVEKADVEKAVSLIQEQFKRIIDGDFDDALLETTRTMMINSLVATKDSMSSLMAQAYQNAVLRQTQSIDDRIEKVRNVKREDVQRAFSLCRHQLTFVVSKQEGEHEENSK